MKAQAAHLFSRPEFEPFLSPEEAAHLLGVHAKTIVKRAHEGEVPALCICKHWRFRASLLDEYVKNQLTLSGQPAWAMRRHDAIASNRSRYQGGTLERAKRAKAPNVRVLRWRELDPDEKRQPRKRVIETIEQLKKLTEARRASDSLRLAVNTAADGKAVVVVEKPTVTCHSRAVFSVAYSPDGKRLATASEDHTAKVWDAESGKELHLLKT